MIDDERKSRAAGLSTDMQIAFSWLPYSAWYLSSGLQYVSLFTEQEAADQVYHHHRRGQKEGADTFLVSTARWKFKLLQWPDQKDKNIGQEELKLQNQIKVL